MSLGFYLDLQWSCDRQRIVASGDGKGKAFVRAFMWDSGTNVGEFDGHSKRVLSCAFKPTQPFRIVTCGEDFLVNFYEGPPFKFKLSHKYAFVIGRGHSNFVNCVRFFPDGSKFVSVSSDKKGIIYDGKTRETIGELSSEDGHKGCIYAVSWRPDSKQVLTVSAEKSAKLWEITEDGNGKVTKTLECPGSGGVEDILVGCLWLNDHLVTVSLGGMITIFSASDPDKLPLSFSRHLKSVNSLVVRRLPLCGNQCGDAEVVDVGSQPKDLNLTPLSPELALVSTDSGVYAVTASAIAPDGSEAIVGGQDGKLHIYSINGDTLTEEAVLEKHRGAISVIRYSPDASMFVSGDLNREVVVWDRVSKAVKLNNMLYHSARINCLAWSPDSNMVATGSLDTCVIIYEIGKPASSRITIKGAHLGGVYRLSFIDDCTVVSSGEDACVRLWTVSPQ
ncbi:hypothetical protein GIB67_007071 [Kingdonia uniflora]|uniref:Actin-interacting protein 1-2 n=1 Tax=Kingdonia uniflora TaxID=39325 RepID=A0A7J7P056_9MAGN|nr:hypothetical protein GIB67_007071 [Kingdonia uniflora]